MTRSADLAHRLRRVRFVLLDVDGVLTDGRLGYGPAGDTGRQFHVRDGSAIKLAQAAGIPVGLLTGRNTEATARWAEDIGLAEVRQGCRVKAPAWDELLARRGLAPQSVAYMGDDVLDLPLLARAGLAAAPADAAPEVLAAAHFRAERPGGSGCVRELLEAVLREQGRWDDLIVTPFWPDGSAPAG